MSQKKALIIGGSGGLSSRVAEIAMQSGYEVYAVTRGKRPLPKGVTGITADRNNSAEFEAAVLSTGFHFDVVFDCICMNRSHALSDLKVVSQVTGRLVVVSTDSVYDPAHKETPQKEEGIFIEEEGSEDSVSYGCNKRRMELAFLEDWSSGKTTLNTTIFRPGHIYGPGFLLGCFPECSRQADIPDRILAGEPMPLVGMGTYLIHPIYVDDLAGVMVECVSNPQTFNEIFCIGGPEAIENRIYYEWIAKHLGRELCVEEVPLKGYVRNHPEYAGHLNHRIYDLTKLKETGIKLPDTHIEDGIYMHLKSLGYVK